MIFHQHRLANGLEIVAERNPDAISAAIGFFVRTGARDETPELSGVSHFLEHMAFKGSDRRSAEDVNRQFDEIGAKYNAYTSEEHTVFHATVLPKYMPTALELLADLLRPSLRTDDFDMEKKVILEEIGMYADSPMWSAYERVIRLHFADHPLGNSVLGTRESVGALTPGAMCRYHQSRYVPDNVFVAAAGKIDGNQLCDLVEEHCGSWQAGPVNREIKTEHSRGPNDLVVRPEFVQECIFQLVRGPDATDPRRFAAELLATIVGDETGSRFHWALADPGRVDSVDFHFHEYEGMGIFIASAGCSPDLAEANLTDIRKILADVTRAGVTEKELDQAKNKLGARVVLAGERTGSRLTSLGYNWSYRREYRTIAEDLSAIESVTCEDIANLLRDFPLIDMTTLCLGPLDKLPSLNNGV